MSTFFSKAALYTGILILVCLTYQTNARGAPVVIDPVFIPNGTDLTVKFKIRDEANNAYDNLPQTFRVSLTRNGVVIDSVDIRITQMDVTAHMGGGFESNEQIHMFKSVPAGGTFALTVALAPVPEPATLLLLGTGLAGVAMKMRKKLKRRKSGQGSQ